MNADQVNEKLFIYLFTFSNFASVKHVSPSVVWQIMKYGGEKKKEWINKLNLK